MTSSVDTVDIVDISTTTAVGAVGNSSSPLMISDFVHKNKKTEDDKKDEIKLADLTHTVGEFLWMMDKYNVIDDLIEFQKENPIDEKTFILSSELSIPLTLKSTTSTTSTSTKSTKSEGSARTTPITVPRTTHRLISIKPFGQKVNNVKYSNLKYTSRSNRFISTQSTSSLTTINDFGISKYLECATTKERLFYNTHVRADEETRKRIATAPQGSIDWLRFRSYRIGGSDCGSFVSKHKFKTLYDSIYNRLFCANDKSTKIMMRGTNNEEQGRMKLFADFNHAMLNQVNRKLKRDCGKFGKVGKMLKQKNIAFDQSNDEFSELDKVNNSDTINDEVPEYVDLNDDTNDDGNVEDVIDDDVEDVEDVDDDDDDAIRDQKIQDKKLNKKRPTVRFYYQVHEIPEDLITKWEMGILITVDDMFTLEEMVGSKPHATVHLAAASSDGGFILWGVLVTGLEFKWPAANEPYHISQKEHYDQCQYTMFVHLYPMMLYVVFSEKRYTVTIFRYNKAYCEEYLIIIVIERYFTVLLPIFVMHEEYEAMFKATIELKWKQIPDPSSKSFDIATNPMPSQSLETLLSATTPTVMVNDDDLRVQDLHSKQDWFPTLSRRSATTTKELSAEEIREKIQEEHKRQQLTASIFDYHQNRFMMSSTVKHDKSTMQPLFSCISSTSSSLSSLSSSQQSLNDTLSIGDSLQSMSLVAPHWT
jgi:hypothetical protein